MSFNDDFDFYSTNNKKSDEPEPPKTTWINGIEFYKGERLLISGFLFEIQARNRLYYVGHSNNSERFKNTVFDITGENFNKFFHWSGLKEYTAKKVINTEEGYYNPLPEIERFKFEPEELPF